MGEFLLSHVGVYIFCKIDCGKQYIVANEKIFHLANKVSANNRLCSARQYLYFSKQTTTFRWMSGQHRRQYTLLMPLPPEIDVKLYKELPVENGGGGYQLNIKIVGSRQRQMGEIPTLKYCHQFSQDVLLTQDLYIG